MQLSNYNSFPSDIPVIIEEDLFLYPFMIAPIFLASEENIKAAAYAIEHNSLAIVCPTRSSDDEESSFYDAGVIGTIMRKVVLPDGRVKVLFQGLARGRVLNVQSQNPVIATVDTINSHPHSESTVEAIMENLREHVKTLSGLTNYFPQDLLRTIHENHEPNRIIDLIASSIRLKKEQAYLLFIEADVEKRLMMLIDFIIEETEAAKLQKEIKTKVHSKIDKINREYFLKEQLKQIRKELGEDTTRDEEIERYTEKLEALRPHMPEDGYKETKKQIERLSRMHPDSADANTLQTFIEWVLEMPFGKYAKTKMDVHAVEKRLAKDHYGLAKPKERIIEFFAVRELIEKRKITDKEAKGAILCFIGPPGVGKTSLANSIAKALGRELVRIALGGLEDVNELRGHRRTYVGAMPGRIVQGLIGAKQNNPVVVLDEIDKVGRNHRGDPTAVLLEILDPEQNDKFRDYYLNFNIDLSEVLFIATANEIGTIPGPLRDRMEFIQVSSYTPDEKFQIAKKYLVPQEMTKHGLKSGEIAISDTALNEIIASYTREAGVRNLRRRIATVMRKSATKLLADSVMTKVSITLKNLKEFMDKIVFEIDPIDKIDRIGVVNGLAWTSVGGDVLTIEAMKIRGKGALQLTGSLGDVMKESARIAHSVVKHLIDTKRLIIEKHLIPLSPKEKESDNDVDDSQMYHRYDLHIHVPEGATPKDGPSAGIAMVTVIASILSERKIRSNVAMTGEVTLTGLVLPIGGLKEKLIAAHKAKITTALIPVKNYERDLDEIPEIVKKELTIIPVKTVDDVLKQALCLFEEE